MLLGATDGRIGLGEAVLEPDATEVEETILARVIRETAGRAREGDLPDAEELELLGGPGRAFRAALDAARLDLAIVADGVVVPVNGTIGFAAPREGAEAALQAIEAGFTTLKLKAGAERETEDLVARVRAIRQAVGPDVRLRLDVNGAWDLPTAQDRLEAVERFDIQYVEQPLPADDADGAAELRRRVGVPIAADEAVYARERGPAAPRRGRRGRARRQAGARRGAGCGRRDRGRGAGVRRPGRPLHALRDGHRDRGRRVRAPAGCRVTCAHGLATAGLLEHDLLVDPLEVDAGDDDRAGWSRGRRAGDPGRRPGAAAVRRRGGRGGRVSVARSLPLAIRAHAAARPQALAVRDAAGDLTFVELDGRPTAVAESLGERRRRPRRPGCAARRPVPRVHRAPRRDRPRGSGGRPAGNATDAARGRRGAGGDDDPRCCSTTRTWRRSRSATVCRRSTSPPLLAGHPRRRQLPARPLFRRGARADARRRPRRAGRRGPHLGNGRPPAGGAALASCPRGERRGLDGRPPAGDGLAPLPRPCPRRRAGRRLARPRRRAAPPRGRRLRSRRRSSPSSAAPRRRATSRSCPSSSPACWRPRAQRRETRRPTGSRPPPPPHRLPCAPSSSAGPRSRPTSCAGRPRPAGR